MSDDGEKEPGGLPEAQLARIADLVVKQLSRSLPPSSAASPGTSKRVEGKSCLNVGGGEQAFSKRTSPPRG